MNQQQPGVLYGLGVGPGDPKLLTLKALEILGQVEDVFAAGSSKNDYSLSFKVAAPHLRPGARVGKLNFPMTADQEVLRQAWEDNARQVLQVLDAGRDAVFLTLGDPMTYSTYIYLLRTLRQLDPQVRVETVPGVTAYHAAAARLNLPLVEGNQSLMVVSGVADPAEVSRLAQGGDTVVIMKAYRNYDRILDQVQGLGGGRHAYTVCSCCLEDEKLCRDAEELRGSSVPYLSLMIIKPQGEDG